MKILKYDYILFGSSPLVIFQAAYLISQKYKIAIIEKKSSLGGSWQTISLRDFNNVENAIHYFLNYNLKSDFLTKNLKLKIEKVKNKKVVYKNKTNPYSKKSFYLKYGCIELEKVIHKLIKKFKIKIIKNTNLEKIKIKNNNLIAIKTKNKLVKRNTFYFSKKILITSGLKIDHINFEKKKHVIYNRKLYRPTLHLVIDNLSYKKFYGELIFKNSSLIKYVHDVTPYAKSKITSLKKSKNFSILVIALKHHLKYNKRVYKRVFNLLKKRNILKKNVKIVEYKWNDIYLPPIPLYELKKIEKKFGNFIEVMHTENFINTVQTYNKIWKNSILL